MGKILVYHGSKEKVVEPEIRKTKYTKDFSWGFYCTIIKKQAEKWATRIDGKGYVNIFEYQEKEGLNIKVFEEISYEWLDFVVHCRSGNVHDFDIVEGPMADDTIYNYVEDYISGDIERDAFMELVKFKKPTHQISFHTIKALSCLKFIDSKEVL
ncbi:putative uncharacterized protein [Amedibacillus dolichus CAG:375]|uniref:DUF3990 domain-containing protein n=1 Tax=Amedibacillus dolichus CAG:375 TaxID=1263076 RepID=R7G8G1_9FIRM|nr:DUF3990 domain-containing protein [Amedibacillus dolichus]CDE22267.1 putative uncharacterized protein [Amedibacillus dolichus CAG:375]